jgi:GGDEF domain-containing protein
MGGDEFCVLAPLATGLHEFSAECAAALATHGDGFSITAAHGAALLPDEGRDPSILVADAFDAMVSERSYGVTLSDADALAELHRCSGTQFDPGGRRRVAARRRPAPAA